jgi:hypothetical protein
VLLDEDSENTATEGHANPSQHRCDHLSFTFESSESRQDTTSKLPFIDFDTLLQHFGTRATRPPQDNSDHTRLVNNEQNDMKVSGAKR